MTRGNNPKMCLYRRHQIPLGLSTGGSTERGPPPPAHLPLAPPIPGLGPQAAWKCWCVHFPLSTAISHCRNRTLYTSVNPEYFSASHSKTRGTVAWESGQKQESRAPGAFLEKVVLRTEHFRRDVQGLCVCIPEGHLK